MALTERPYQFAYSKNEIRYVFLLDDLTRSNLYLEVQLFYAPIGSSDFISYPSFTLKPDSVGNIYVYLQFIIDSLLNYAVPVPATIENNAEAQMVQFYVNWRQVDDDDPDPDFTSESGAIRFALKGGVEKNRMSRNNFFVNHFKVNKPWLSWQPAGKFVFADEPVYCTLFNPLLTAGLKLRIVVTDKLGLTATHDVALSTAYLLHLSAGITANSLAGLVANPVYYYDVSVVNAANVTVINAKRFYKEYRPVYHAYDLIYHNSLGGVDNCRVKADVDRTITRDYEEAESGLSFSDATDTAKVHETTQTGITLRKHYTGDIGYQRTRADQEAYSEVLMSTSVYMLLQGRWIPVLNLAKQQDLGKENDKTRSFGIEWALSELNEVFTPNNIALGFGNSDDDY